MIRINRMLFFIFIIILISAVYVLIERIVSPPHVKTIVRTIYKDSVRYRVERVLDTSHIKILDYDTMLIYRGDTAYVNPTYEGVDTTPTYNIRVEIDKDTFKYDLSFDHKQSLLFKPTLTSYRLDFLSSCMSSNMHRTMKISRVSPSIYVGGGLAVTTTGMYPAIHIGIGLSYNLKKRYR